MSQKENDKVKQLETENEVLKKQLEDTNFLLGQYLNKSMQLEQQLMLSNKRQQAESEDSQNVSVETAEGEMVN
tara:strand:- start:131 stop:349 length:219 start_codon:yes stop_codon:yes gene_type:complete